MHTRQTFSFDHFRADMSVDYLKMCDLTHDDRETLFSILRFGSINFECMKFIIDCYGDGTFDWSEIFDHFGGFTYCSPFRIICSQCTEETILYMLDVCDKCNLSTKFTEYINDKYLEVHSSMLSIIGGFITGDWLGSEFSSHDVNFEKIMICVLDIYVRKNLCLNLHHGCMGGVFCKCKTNYKNCTFLRRVLSWKNSKITKRVLDIFVERQIDFDEHTLSSLFSYWTHGNNCMYKYLMSSEREVFE